MKQTKFIIFNLFALVACSKTAIDIPSSSDATAFEKGQEVTLTLNSACGTKVNGTLDPSNSNIDFKWESSDIIKVTVGTASAPFHFVKTNDGGTSAEFVGFMPAAGNTFDVQFPYDTPDLSTQEYVQNCVPHNKVLATATDCTLGNSFSLSPQCSALRLNLYGLERKVTQIVITDKTTSGNPTYTLTCNDPVRLGSTSSEATSFLIVVPTGSYNFNANVTSQAVEPSTLVLPKYPNDDEPNYGSGILTTNCNFTTSVAKNFTAGKVLNMPTVSHTSVWAPVNCGYDASHTYGLFYQWGRKAPCEYSESWTDGSGSHGAEPLLQTILPVNFISAYNSKINDSDFNDYIYTTANEPYDWYSNQYSDTPSDNKLLKAWPLTSGDEGYIANKIANPCPSGWRPPTFEELDRLVGGDGNGTGCATPTSFVSYNNMNGHWFNGSSTANKKKTGSDTEYEGIFLPATGYRNYSTGLSYDRGNRGSYWSMNVVGQFAGRLDIWNSSISVASSSRSNGYSVRCVYDQNSL